MQQDLEIKLNNIEDTVHLAQKIAQQLDYSYPQILFLKGNLGSGKTTFSQLLLQELGYTGLVKSPSYSLMEIYSLANNYKIYHLDLYRLKSADEIYFMGLLDHLQENALFLIEWPELLEEIGIQPQCILEFSWEASNDTLQRKVKMTVLK